jgi:hypothetical protein
LDVGEAALARAGDPLDLALVSKLARVAKRLGKGERRVVVLQRGLETEGGNPRARALLETEEAERLADVGDSDAALAGC